MSIFTNQSSPQIRGARLALPPCAETIDFIVRETIERGSEQHPGQPELQQSWDEYLDALYLANRSQKGRDAIVAGRLYLRWANDRDELEARK